MENDDSLLCSVIDIVSDDDATVEEKPSALDKAPSAPVKSSGKRKKAPSDSGVQPGKVAKKGAKPKKASKPKPEAKPRVSVNAYVKLAELGARSPIRRAMFIDIGTVNFALLVFDYRALRITFVRILNLNDICRDYEAAHPTVSLGKKAADPSKTKYSEQALALAMEWYTRKESDGGCFDVDAVIIEKQSFNITMAAVEASIRCAVNAVKPLITILPGVHGTTFPAARSQSASAVKSAYRNLFPSKLSEAALAKAKARKPRTDFQASFSRTPVQAALHAQNKANAIKWGSLMIPKHRFGELVEPENLTSRDIRRLAQAKADDLYDVLIMLWHFTASTMFQIDKIRRRGKCDRDIPACSTLPMRDGSNCEELVEFCRLFNTPAEDAHKLLEAATGKELPLALFQRRPPVERTVPTKSDE